MGSRFFSTFQLLYVLDGVRCVFSRFYALPCGSDECGLLFHRIPSYVSLAALLYAEACRFDLFLVSGLLRSRYLSPDSYLIDCSRHSRRKLVFFPELIRPDGSDVSYLAHSPSGPLLSSPTPFLCIPLLKPVATKPRLAIRLLSDTSRLVTVRRTSVTRVGTCWYCVGLSISVCPHFPQPLSLSQ